MFCLVPPDVSDVGISLTVSMSVSKGWSDYGQWVGEGIGFSVT